MRVIILCILSHQPLHVLDSPFHLRFRNPHRHGDKGDPLRRRDDGPCHIFAYRLAENVQDSSHGFIHPAERTSSLNDSSIPRKGKPGDVHFVHGFFLPLREERCDVPGNLVRRVLNPLSLAPLAAGSQIIESSPPRGSTDRFVGGDDGCLAVDYQSEIAVIVIDNKLLPFLGELVDGVDDPFLARKFFLLFPCHTYYSSALDNCLSGRRQTSPPAGAFTELSLAVLA